MYVRKAQALRADAVRPYTKPLKGNGIISALQKYDSPMLCFCYPADDKAMPKA